MVLKNKNASVLILALWALTFLGVYALNIGLRVRQRAELISRIEDRSKLRYVAQAGVKKAISAIKWDVTRNNFQLTQDAKVYRHNNDNRFSRIIVGDGLADVSYSFPGNDYGNAGKIFGVVDEERKININFVEPGILSVLIMNVLGIDQQDASSLALAVIDWRSFGASQMTGFYSDDYYANLEFPYESKNSAFESLDELLLVKGFENDVFKKLIPFLTIYGDGKININTASREVLCALGLDDVVADKLLQARRGPDGIESTSDDHIFFKGHDMASEVNNLVGLEEPEMKQLDALNARGWIKMNSYFYWIQSRGKLGKKKMEMFIQCVYDSFENRIVYWHEK